MPINPKLLVDGYDNSTVQKPLVQGLTNYLYVRAKNLDAAPLAQHAWVFHLPGTLACLPERWYKREALLGWDDHDPTDPQDPTDPNFLQKYSRPMKAEPGGVVVSDAFQWAPESAEHQCVVTVVADSWQNVLKSRPNERSWEGLARWIYGNPSFGWYNLDIRPIKTRVAEEKIEFTNGYPTDEKLTFTLHVQNVPVGAKVSFAANTATSHGQVIGLDWTTVSAGADLKPINPHFEIGVPAVINPEFHTVLAYRTDFDGRAVPPDFKMEMKLTRAATAPKFAVAPGDSLAASFHRAHSPTAMFRGPDGTDFGEGLEGYLAMLAASPRGADDGPEDLKPEVVVVVGNHITVPAPA